MIFILHSTEIEVKPKEPSPVKTPELTRWIQKVLRIKEDGIFWTETEAAVIKYQHAHNLEEDGVVGYNTVKSMALS